MPNRLTLLLNAAERLTVDLVAQDPVTIRLDTDTPGDARHLADRENFDVLPIREADGRIVRYVHRIALDRRASETKWDGIELDEIHPDDIVSASSPMLELLDRFSRERPRLFVLGRRGIDSIVTVFDLNQPAAHQFGFALSLVVEAELGRAIEDAARKEESDLDAEVDHHIFELVMKLSAKDYRGMRDRVRAWRQEMEIGRAVAAYPRTRIQRQDCACRTDGDRLGARGALSRPVQHRRQRTPHTSAL